MADTKTETIDRLSNSRIMRKLKLTLCTPTKSDIPALPRYFKARQQKWRAEELKEAEKAALLEMYF